MQIFIWNEIIALFIFPGDTADPPSLSIVIELEAVDSSDRIAPVILVHDFLVSAENLSDMGIHIRPA